jgi:hypothetical protein
MKIHSPKNIFLSSLQISFLMKKLFTLILTALTVFCAEAQVVIYEFYGGGQGTAATTAYKADYAVLLNKGTSAVDLSTWSIQYASATGPSSGMWGIANLTGSIGAGKYYLIKFSTEGTVGATLPTPDANFTTISASNTAGKVALVNNQTALTSTTPLPNAAIVDMIGFGTTATQGEGGTLAPTPTTGGAHALRRKNMGQDTDNNAADFENVTPPSPLNSTIPVEMTSFTAKKVGTANKLAWQTATEINNYYFDVERSNDGATFQNIGKVKGVGNTNTLSNYDFMDENPLAGTNYYRLQQVDVNGKTTTSKTVAVNANGKGSVKVFPTLATDKLSVLTTSEKEEAYEIVNLVGQIVAQGRLTNSADVQISQLAKGNYVLKIAGEAVKFTKQ